MPQMAPLWWTSLFLFFSILFLLISSLIFSFFLKISDSTEMSDLMISSPKFNWSW